MNAPASPLRPKLTFDPAHCEQRQECRILQVIYTSHTPGGGAIVLGQIVRFHVRENLVDDFRVDPNGLDAVGWMVGLGRESYFQLQQLDAIIC